MKKKGLLAMGLAGVLTVGMCMPVFAADSNTIIESNAGDGNATTEVSVTNPVKYSVTIPSSVIIEKGADSVLKVTLDENAVLGKGKDIQVTLSGGGYTDGKLTLTSVEGQDTVQSTVTSPVEGGKLSTAVKELEYTLSAPTMTNAGVYKGSLIFEIQYNGKEGLPAA